MKRVIQTPESRVRGLGAAGDGVAHWWAQRLTAIALVPLLPAFLIPFAGVAGGSHATVADLYGNPLHAVIAILFLAVSTYHLFLGMRVVVEDYVHHPPTRIVLLVGNALGCTFLGALGGISVLLLAIS